MNICERLQLLSTTKAKSERDFALAVGVSQQTMSNYLKGRNPSYEALEGIIRAYPDVNAEWLLTGEGEMLKTTANIDNRTITTGDQSAAGDGSQVVVNEKPGVGHIILESVNKLLNMDCLDATHVDRVLALMEKYAKE